MRIRQIDYFYLDITFSTATNPYFYTLGMMTNRLQQISGFITLLAGLLTIVLGGLLLAKTLQQSADVDDFYNWFYRRIGMSLVVVLGGAFVVLYVAFTLRRNALTRYRVLIQFFGLATLAIALILLIAVVFVLIDNLDGYGNIREFAFGLLGLLFSLAMWGYVLSTFRNTQIPSSTQRDDILDDFLGEK